MRCRLLLQPLLWQLAAGVLVWQCLMPVSRVNASYKTCTRADRQHPRGVCGPRLTLLIATVCRSIYHKRSTNGFTGNLETLEGEQADKGGLLRPLDALTSANSVFVPKSRALSSYLRVSKRAVYDYDSEWDDVMVGDGQRGLSCECCVHRCTTDEMTQYCQHPPALLLKRLALQPAARTSPL